MHFGGGLSPAREPGCALRHQCGSAYIADPAAAQDISRCTLSTRYADCRSTAPRYVFQPSRTVTRRLPARAKDSLRRQVAGACHCCRAIEIRAGPAPSPPACFPERRPPSPSNDRPRRLACALTWPNSGRPTMPRCQRTIVSGVTSNRSPWRRASVSRQTGPRAGPGPPSSGSGGAAAAVALRRAGGAGSRSLRSAMPPHAGTAAAMRPPA